VDLEDDGRAAQGDQEAVEDGVLGGHAQSDEDRYGGQRGQEDLEPAAQPEAPLDPPQALQGELQPDHEQEHDDPDLGEDVDHLAVLDDREAAGPIRTPVSRKPTTGGSLIRLEIRMTMTETARRTTSSLRTGRTTALGMISEAGRPFNPPGPHRPR
jgi:hypothetical protein